jgi:hypothetical protein
LGTNRGNLWWRMKVQMGNGNYKVWWDMMN